MWPDSQGRCGRITLACDIRVGGRRNRRSPGDAIAAAASSASRLSPSLAPSSLFCFLSFFLVSRSFFPLFISRICSRLFFSLPLLLFLPFYLSFLLILFCLHVFLLFPPFSPLRLENVSVYLDLSHSLCVSVCLSLYHSLPPSSSHLPPNALFLSHLLSLSSLSIYPPSPSSSLPHTLSSLSLSSSFFL